VAKIENAVERAELGGDVLHELCRPCRRSKGSEKERRAQ
jgi:hypothetical protein